MCGLAAPCSGSGDAQGAASAARVSKVEDDEDYDPRREAGALESVLAELQDKAVLSGTQWDDDDDDDDDDEVRAALVRVCM